MAQISLDAKKQKHKSLKLEYYPPSHTHTTHLPKYEKLQIRKERRFMFIQVYQPYKFSITRRYGSTKIVVLQIPTNQNKK